MTIGQAGVCCACATLLLGAAARAENIVYPGDAGLLNVTAAPYNAAGNGISDDTAALSNALAAASAGRIVYLPNGTYRVSGGLRWPGTSGGMGVIMQGQSTTGVVIRLQDSAAGFTNAAAPAPVLWTGQNDPVSGPVAFGNSLRNLTVHTGSGNAGAIGVQYYANNYGCLRDVIITSGDGQGSIGLDMAHSRNNGPNFVKNLTVAGFQTGIKTGRPAGGTESNEGGTLEHITLTNQTLCGMLVQQAQLSVRDLRAHGLICTALRNDNGHLDVIDATLRGTGAAAISNGANARLLLRNLSTSGYAQALNDGGVVIAGPAISEWTSDAPVTQFLGSTMTTLNLPIEETPEVPWDYASAPGTWTNVLLCGATSGMHTDDDAPGIQRAIDAGLTTVYFPAGSDLRLRTPVYIRGNVRRLVGCGNAVAVGTSSAPNAFSNNTPAFIMTTGAAPVVVWQDVHGSYGIVCQIDNRSARTLVMRDCGIQGGEFTGAGDLFLESVCGNPFRNFRFTGTQHVWARQLNPECTNTHVVVDNGTTCWMLGLKTEKNATVLDARGQASVELLGSFVYPVDDADGQTMFVIADARCSLSFFEFLYGTPYGTLVREEHAGVVRTLARGTPPTYPAPYTRRPDGLFGSDITLYVNGVPEPAGLGLLALAGLLLRHAGRLKCCRF